MRVLAISSAGGHWVQLRRLKAAFEGLDVAYASVYAANGDEVAGHRYYTFTNMSRFNKWRLFKVAVEIFTILRRERPQVVITTGAFPALIGLVMAKYMFGAHTVWIDSIANCEELSTSGRHAGRIADVWLTQWEHLAGPERPAFLGAVL